MCLKLNIFFRPKPIILKANALYLIEINSETQDDADPYRVIYLKNIFFLSLRSFMTMR